nr:uncharacterized protein LOC129259256 [Lytechinus pictus]
MVVDSIEYLSYTVSVLKVGKPGIVPKVLPPEQSDVSSTQTNVSFIPTNVPFTQTGVPSTPTNVPFTQRVVPSTPTNVPFTQRVVPSTPTNVPFTQTGVPSTPTNVPSTQTVVPSTPTNVPSTPTNVPFTKTGVPSTPTNVSSTQTVVPSTQTNVPSTQTNVPSTPTNVPFTKTGVPSTPTNVSSTQTVVPSTPTNVPSTKTVVPSTKTVVPSTPTNVSFTQTGVPSTPTNVPFTKTVVPSTQTNVPSTQTNVPSTQTGVPSIQTNVPFTQTGVPSTPTNVPSTQTNVPFTKRVVPSTPTNVPFTKTVVPSTPTNVPSTQTGVPATPTEVPSSQTEVPSIPAAVLSTQTEPATLAVLPVTQTLVPSTPFAVSTTPTAASFTQTFTPVVVPVTRVVVESTPTTVPSTPTLVPSTPILFPSTPTKLQSTSTTQPLNLTTKVAVSTQNSQSNPAIVPSTPTVVPSCPTEVTATETVLPSTPTAVQSTQIIVPSTPTVLPFTPTAVASTPTIVPSSSKVSSTDKRSSLATDRCDLSTNHNNDTDVISSSAESDQAESDIFCFKRRLFDTEPSFPLPRSRKLSWPIGSSTAGRRHNVHASTDDDTDVVISNSADTCDDHGYRFCRKRSRLDIESSDDEEKTLNRRKKHRTLHKTEKHSKNDITRKKYKKPARFCIFCHSYKSKLSQHIMTQHKNQLRVKNALLLPRKDRISVLNSLKKEGTLEVNKKEARCDIPSFERERKSKCHKVVICGNCSGSYAQSYITRHKKACAEQSDSAASAVNLPAELLTLAKDADIGEDFVADILSKFRDDEIGDMCKTDPVLLTIGRRLWSKQKRKVDKKTEVRKSVMRDMRRLASLYKIMQQTESKLGELPAKEGNVSDLMKRANFRHLEEAIEEYTTRDVQTGTDVKAGLKSGIYYLLKSACKILKGTYLMDDNDDKAADIDKFVSVLELTHNAVFGDAAYKLHKTREERLRRPSAQPLDKDIKTLKDYILQRIRQITNDKFCVMDSHRFVELRDCVVSRLTLFNARRGGEPSRLFIKHWNDADEGVWLDQQQLDVLDPLDKALAAQFKVGYQSGKGRHLVPILFTEDTHHALRKLADPEVRSMCGIRDDNTYLFPCTYMSEGHVSGWHAIKSLCKKVHLDNSEVITATANRHRVSVLFALTEIPEKDRDFVFKHLGHSGDTNRDIYQAPLAVREITVVGRQLNKMDSAETLPEPSCSNSSTTAAEDFADDEVSSAPTSRAKTVPSNASASVMRDGANVAAVVPTIHSTTASPEKKVHAYTKWEKSHERKVYKHFEKYLKGESRKKIPGRAEVQDFLKGNPGFPHSWKKIHTKVMNEVYKREKRAQRLIPSE